MARETAMVLNIRTKVAATREPMRMEKRSVVSIIGSMAPVTKELGRMKKGLVLAFIFMQMVIPSKELGRMT